MSPKDGCVTALGLASAESQLDPAMTESVAANDIHPAACAPNSDTIPLLSPALFIEILDKVSEQSLEEDKAPDGDKESIQSLDVQADATDGTATARHDAVTEVSSPPEVTVSSPTANEDAGGSVKEAPAAIPTSVPPSPTAFAHPWQDAPTPPLSAPPSSASPLQSNRSVPSTEARTSVSTTASSQEQHVASSHPPVPGAVLACDLGLPAEVTSPSPSTPPSSHSSSSLSPPAPQPAPALPSELSSEDRTNNSGNGKGARARNISSAARHFFAKRKSSFFKLSLSKRGKDLPTPIPTPRPPLPYATAATQEKAGTKTGLGSNGAPPASSPIQRARALTAPSYSSSANPPPLPPPLPSSPSLAIAQDTGGKVCRNRETQEANTEKEKERSVASTPPLPPLPPSPNSSNGSAGSPGVRPRTKGKWHLADSDGDDGETSSVSSDSERDEDPPRGRSLLHVGEIPTRMTSNPAVVAGSAPVLVALSLKSKSTSKTPPPGAPCPEVEEIVSKPPGQDRPRGDKPQTPTLKLEVPSLSDINLAAVIFPSEIDAEPVGEQVGGPEVVTASSSPADAMTTPSPIISASLFTTDAKVADSGQEQKVSEDGESQETEREDASRYSFDAQFLTPGPSPTSGTLSPTFVFPPPGVPRTPASTIPLPPSPVSPSSDTSSLPQSSLSPLSKRKTIIGAIRLVGSVKRGIWSGKKITTNNAERPGPKSAPARSKTFLLTRDRDREEVRQPKSRPHPISIKPAPGSKRASTMPPTRSPIREGGAGGRKYLMVPPASPQIVQSERQPLSPTMHTGGTIYAQTWEIMDEESRRLSEIAFM